MVDVNNTIQGPRKKMQDFIDNWHSSRGLDILIDIYDEIRYPGLNEEAMEQKYFRILFNLKESNSLHTLLEERDRRNLKLFLEDLLKLQYDGERYFLAGEGFDKLSIDEIYQVLIEAKYSRNKLNSIKSSKL